MAWVRVSAETKTEEGYKVKEDEEVEFDVVEGADSSLGDDAGPDGSSEAEMLFTVLRGMWTKPSKKQTEKTKKSSRNRRQRWRTARREDKHRGKTKKMADRTQHKGKTERAKESHDRCSQPPGMRMPKTADLGTQALVVVNSFKLHLNALKGWFTVHQICWQDFLK